ncbi:MAG: winged helix DNA-binding protein [Deltaproteobacteria bacterium]|nr:winged helix DNA-binding protein [Deltaproteobacteria bacterium]MCL4872626.1 winged helix DNA-binding protein [bacterium]
MKAKRIKVGIKSAKEALDDFVKAGEAIERGQKAKKQEGLFFESIEGFRKALTPKRIELLHIIRERHPESIQELARLADRDMRAVVTDISILERYGLVDMKRKKDGRKLSTPIVDYDTIDIKIAV